MREIHFIVDLQFGSTGKGLFAGYLARKVEPDTIMAAWGPNAGHTFIDRDGTKHVNIMIPNGVVADSVQQVLIGPGAVIDMDRMLYEVERYPGIGNKLLIHPHAVVVCDADRLNEMSYGFKIGSTMKGVGEAMIRKIKRVGAVIARDVLPGTPLHGFLAMPNEYEEAVRRARCVLVEGAQGFSLSINHGFYPHTTSRDCTVQQLMVDCAIPRLVDVDVNVYGVARTYPIRVANRFNENGVQIGTSGPCYPDQKEIQWSDIGIEPELTTVTKLPRRVFTFSEQQIRQAIKMNGVDAVFLNFCNYVTPEMRDRLIDTIEDGLPEDGGAPVCWFGNGPTINDIMER